MLLGSFQTQGIEGPPVDLVILLREAHDVDLDLVPDEVTLDLRALPRVSQPGQLGFYTLHCRDVFQNKFVSFDKLLKSFRPSLLWGGV